MENKISDKEGEREIILYGLFLLVAASQLITRCKDTSRQKPIKLTHDIRKMKLFIPHISPLRTKTFHIVDF